MKSRNLIMF